MADPKDQKGGAEGGPKWSDMKRLTDADRRKLAKQRDIEKKQSDEDARGRDTKVKLFGGLIVLALLGVGAGGYYYLTSVKHEAAVKKIVTKVDVRNGLGDIFYAEKGLAYLKETRDIIVVGQSIKTGRGARVDLAAGDGRTLKLLNDTEIVCVEITPSEGALLDTAFELKGGVLGVDGTGVVSKTEIRHTLGKLILNQKVAGTFKMESKKDEKGTPLLRIVCKAGSGQAVDRTGKMFSLQPSNEIIFTPSGPKGGGPTNVMTAGESWP